MEPELKVRLDNIEAKLDTAITHMQEKCDLRHEGIDAHLVEAPKFRDKVMANSIWIVACWTIVTLVLGRILWSAITKG